MTLSNETKTKLADALVPEVIRYIEDNDNYVQLMQNQLIPEAISNALGEVDEDLKYELALIVFDSIYIREAK
jgi:hypothetical protein